MADSKPIKYSQIAEPNLLGPLKKELEQVNDLLAITEDNLKTIISESAKLAKSKPLDSYENIQEVEKGINETAKAVKDLDKVEKDRIKLQEKLKELDDERAKGNFELREQIRLQTKELRDSAKAAAASGDAYEVLKKRTNAAQLEFKKLAAEFGVNSKQAKAAGKEFGNLDKQLNKINGAAKDGRRHVGRYEKGVKSLTRAFKAFATATIILKVLELVQNAVSENTEGAAQFQKIWVRVTATFQVVGLRLSTAFVVIQQDFKSLVVGFQLGFAEFENLFSDNQEQVDKLQKEYDRLAKSSLPSLAGAFAGVTDEIKALVDANVNAVDKTLEYRKAIVANEEAIAELIGTQREQQGAFEDDSKSIEEQILNGIAYRKSLQETNKLEADIAQSRQRIAEVTALANPFSLGAREELAAANRELAELLSNQILEVASTEKEIQKLRDDATQLNLDFYIDDFDNRKTVNERIIADETQTYARREKLLADNLKGAETSFDLQEESLNRSLRERGKAELDFDELRKKTSSEEIVRTIREAGISEPLAIRALEVLRERRTFLQDNAEAQRDLTAAEAESNSLLDDITLQRAALNDIQARGVDLELVLADLAEKRLQSEVDNIRDRLTVAAEGSAEAIRLNKELNDKLLEQNQSRADKEKELETERLADLARFGEAANEAFTLISDLAAQRADERIEAIDAEIAAEEGRVNRLQELAAQGNEDAENNLAVTEKRQAELELQRKRQLERQEKQELAFAAVQAYASKVQAGDPNPLASTISDVSVLRAFISSLPGFFEGTEDTGNTGPLKDKNGAITGFTHENERVLTAQQNRLIGDMTNAELTAVAFREKTRSARAESPAYIVRELRELKQVTKDKPVYLGSDYDKIAGAVVDRIKKGNKLERIHRKSGGIWGS